MRMPSDDAIMIALCCGKECLCSAGWCHRWDFVSETARIKELLNAETSVCPVPSVLPAIEERPNVD